MSLFGINEDHLEKYQSLDERFIRDRAATYFFEATEDSMSPLIMHKDILIVDRSIDPISGCICIVSMNGEMLCRRLKMSGQEELSLQPENSVYPTIFLKEGQDLQVFGVVTSVIRDLLPTSTQLLSGKRKDGFR